MSDDPRIGDLLARYSGVDCVKDGIGLVFFPHDEGVRRNGGRLGSRHGPRLFMEHIRRTGALVNLEHDVDISQLPIATVGAWMTETDSWDTLEESHVHLTERVRSVLDAGSVAFVVGGGNDQSYPNAVALLEASGGQRPVACINIDAHLDVRPRKQGKVHSGSPFRLLLEDERFDGHHFCEFAAQGAQCSAEHARYALDKGARICWLSQVLKQGALAAFREVLASWPAEAAIFVSFDLDSVRGADAPGVSCPGAVGLSADDALAICMAAGEDPRVQVFDLSEFNPDVEAYRTGKLVAAMCYHFALGYQRRLNQRRTAAQ